jgi:antitoxin component YwqK of YwqJK toxin-antitoxin module
MNMKKIILLFATFCLMHVNGQSIKISYSDSSFFPPRTKILRSDLPDGYYEVYYEILKTGKNYEGQIKTNLRTGTWIWYNSDGKKEREANYYSGQLHGSYKEYYATGQLKSLFEVKNGFPEGTMSELCSNGLKKSEGFFSDGARSGLWRFWDESGSLNK